MSDKYPGGFVTLTPPTQDPALGAATPGIWTLDQAMTAAKMRSWPMYDPYYKNVVLNLHGEGTNGAQNNTFLDSSTNNFTITRNGNTTQGSFSPYGNGWSNYFDSTGYLYSGAGSTALQFSTGSYSVEAWIYQSSRSGTQWIFGGASGIGFQFGITSAGYVFGSIPGVGDITAATTAVPLNTWTHVAYVRTSTSANGAAYYINGIPAGTATDTNNISGTGVVNIGTTNNGTSVTGFNGYISNLRVVKGAAVYSGTFTPSTVPLSVFSSGTTSILSCQSNRFIDNSGTLTLSVSGSSSVQRFSPFLFNTSYTPSTIGGSGYFDGSGDYLTIADNAAFQFGSGDFTIESWAYVSSNSSDQFIYARTNALGAGNLFGIDGASGKWRASVSTNGASNITILSSSVASVNSWNHLAVTRSGTTLTLWVNGVSAGTNTVSGALDNPSSTSYIGVAYPGVLYGYITGYISNLRITKGGALYTTTFTPPTAPLTTTVSSGTVSLLENMTNGAIYDNAMMNDLETVGNAQISTSVKKYGTGSLAFDGSGDYLYGSSSNQFGLGSGDFTIEFWSYSAVAPGTNTYSVFEPRTTGTQIVPSILIRPDSSSNVIGILVNGSFVITGPSFTFNQWNHIALSKSGSSTRLFVNGVQGGSTYTDTNNYVSPSIFCLGAYSPSPTNTYFNGYIDDLRITKGVARYVANFTPPTSQLQDQ